ncbi:YrrS family protein [Neobacillus sp. SM06]|uniref:YrrS family protein n=1 Tax=Neobacillus sp. SM06 TaxID=3422492 RepID=UPI003D2887B8
MNHDFQDNSRSHYRSKRKKTNRILNSLIIIVLLLIAVVAYSIFSSGSNKTASKKSEPKTAVESAQTKNTNQKEKNSNSNSKNQSEASSSTNQDSNAANSTVDSNGTDNTNAVVTQGGSSPNVNQTIENPDWKPVGTSQTGAHTVVYDSNSTDWQEMLKAISYATGLDQSNMTVWFLGRDKSTANGSVGTVSSKDKQQKYRVYIQWVDGQGWRPTKIEKLSEVSQDH